MDFDAQDVFGNLKIKAYFVVAQDEHGRETLAKWVTVANHYSVKLSDAQRISAEYQAKANKGVFIQAVFQAELL